MTGYRGETVASAGVLLAMVLAVLGLYGSSLTGWWCCDDPQILKHATHYTPMEYCTVPTAWRALIPFSLTPWLTLAYDIDLALFGVNPMGFYAHNLLAIAACAFLVYQVARQWVDVWHGAAGAFLFLAGAPIAVASQELMVRHYVEGLFFFLLALLLVVRGVRNDRNSHGWLAALAFAIAASAKEVYLPLGFVVFLLPEGSFRHRLRLAWPLLLVMLCYVFWRRFMLGVLVGGYAPAAELGRTHFGAAIQQFAGVPAMLLMLPWVGGAGVAVVAGWQAARGGKSWWPLLAALPLLLVGPLLPLVHFPGLGPGSERFFIAIWAAFALGVAILCGLFSVGRPARLRLFAMAVLLLLMVSALGRSRQVLTSLRPGLRAQHVQGRAVLAAGERDILALTPDLASWYVSGLLDLRKDWGSTGGPPLLVADEVDYLGLLPLADRRVLRYDPGTETMADITAELPGIMAQWRKRLRPAPLSVNSAFDAPTKTLHWRFAPRQQGTYLLLAGGRQPVAAEGMIRMELPPAAPFRIRYAAPEGWVAYTPLLSLDPAAGDRVSWQGAGELFPGTP